MPESTPKTTATPAAASVGRAETRTTQQQENAAKDEAKAAEKEQKKLEQSARKIANENTGEAKLPAGGKILRQPLDKESPVPLSAMVAADTAAKEESAEGET